IALAAPLSGEQAAIGREIRQGAEMALADLGAGKISLEFYDTAGSASRAKGASDAIAASGARLAAIVGDSASLAAFAPAGASTIAFAADGTRRGAGSFAFLPSETDSLVYGVRFALAAKPGAVLLFTPDTMSQLTVQTLTQTIGRFATVNAISYGASQTSAQIAQKARKNLKDTTVIAFAGNDQKIAQIVKSLAPAAQGGPGIVGNMGWSSVLASRPELQGALVPALDKANQEIVAARYTKKYGTAPTINALYAFDFVAVAAGIVRSRGAAALTRETLTADAGFRGATGSFRFRADGRVERLYAIYVIDKRSLVPLQKAADGF
ncbi:MAG: ABC transporter substrate-binding protein, partial [Oricola sp.]